MICNDCMNSFYAQAISTGVCEKCGKETYTPHMPAYKVCKECSKKYNICEQCGKVMSLTIKINGDTFVTDATEWTYEMICDFADLNPEYTYSCTYSAKNEEGWKKTGILGHGDKIKLYNNMIINICDTSNA